MNSERNIVEKLHESKETLSEAKSISSNELDTICRKYGYVVKGPDSNGDRLLSPKDDMYPRIFYIRGKFSFSSGWYDNVPASSFNKVIDATKKAHELVKLLQTFDMSSLDKEVSK